MHDGRRGERGRGGGGVSEGGREGERLAGREEGREGEREIWMARVDLYACKRKQPHELNGYSPKYTRPPMRTEAA